jgi:creatinine amidohydrolase
MHLLKMRPADIREAVDAGLPVLIAVGVVEYHGPHLPVGTDILMTESLCAAIEQRCRCVVAPSLPYGPTMRWAGGEAEGEIDFEPEPFFLYAKEMLRGLLAIGFRRIYLIHHHAGPDGLQALCLKRAVAELTRDIGRSWGAGWGRKHESRFPEPDLFRQVQVAGLDLFSEYPPGESERLQLSHAGKGETQWMMAAYPDTVRMDSLAAVSGGMPYWLEDAGFATADEGARWFEFCVSGWVKELSSIGGGAVNG